jgi:hypothetical protein
MKAKQARRISLTADGKDEWEMTEEYKDKVAKIIIEVRDKYSVVLLNERNWIKRFLMKLRFEIEIGRKINELSSPRNLHMIGGATL